MSLLRRAVVALATALFLLTAAPVLVGLAMVTLLVADLAALLVRRRRPAPATRVSTDAVSVIVPTWNGREHLRANLPSVVQALADNPDHEILVVENGSRDGSAELLARDFPSVRVVELASNLGFGRAANLGFSIARHDVVILLNNDMRVEPGFLQPLLDGFHDPRVFSVSGQIYFQDASRRREETGLTVGRWHQGRVVLEHVEDPHVNELFPTFYSGGGSSAYDRLKILELGGFDEMLSPFYMEDVDLSYMAWKRGWINLYAPGSVLHHLHRGTIGEHFATRRIDHVVQRNRLLFLWKNLHSWRRLPGHFGWVYADLWLSLAGARGRWNAWSLGAAALQLPRAARSRVAARARAEIPDAEAFRRPLGGWFRDRFHRLEAKRAADLNVLLVSPYPIEPPVHGGAVFMKQAVEGLARRCRLHLLCMVQSEEQVAAHRDLAKACASAELVVHDPRRGHGAPLLWPQSARSFWHPRFLWKLHRTILLRRIDVLQVEYSQMASYGQRFRQLVCCLFEHDLHFQAVQRTVLSTSPLRSARRTYEYLRALRYEVRVLGRFDSVQVCSREQAEALRSVLGSGTPLRHDLRTALDPAGYPFRVAGREPGSILFVGNFRHPPNLEALRFFRDRVLPRVRRKTPGARLVIAGAEPPDPLPEVLAAGGEGTEYVGQIPDIREALGRYAVFVAPILSGSGVRVKILEAFASGIPVVSTSLGVEGLCGRDADIAVVRDGRADFAEAVTELLEDRKRAHALARRARAALERDWDSRRSLRRLVDQYGALLETKLLSRSAYPLPLQLKDSGESR